MLTKRVGIAVGVLAVGVAVTSIYVFTRDKPDDISTGPIASQIPAMASKDDLTKMIETLPASASGMPSAVQAPAAPQAQQAPAADPSAPQASMAGKAAQGRVERVYVRVAEGVLLELDKVLPHQRDGDRYVDIAFPDPLADGATLARAMVPESNQNIGIGDVVEMRFAHKSVKGAFVAEIFPVKERDKITTMVAKAGSTLAQDYTRRIVARAAASGANQPADIALWKSLPFDRAIKIVRGNGKREMAVFSDPYCTACQAFEQTLQQIDDVTLYVFMLPVIRPDKMSQSKSVWCSPDRAKAWTELTLNKKVPEAAPACDNPVDALMALIQPIGIRATPTMIFSNGQRGQGNMQVSALQERLARAESSRQAGAN